MTSSHAPAQWFRSGIIDGVTLLYALGLRGAPPAEVVTLTTTGWIDILWRAPVDWDEERDQCRLAPAFLSLAGAVDSWPAPRALLQHLPPRAEPAGALPAPAVRSTPERRAMLAELRRRVTDHLTSPQLMTRHAVAAAYDKTAPLDRGPVPPTGNGNLGVAGMDSARETAVDAAGAPLGHQ